MRLAPLLLVTTLAACARESPDARPAVERYQRGDTMVVRTVSGSVWEEPLRWREVLAIGDANGPPETTFGRLRAIAVARDGRILAVDGQVPTVRVFSPDGGYLASWGRDGEGPGELKNPDAGLAALADGRVMVRDPGNARIQVFSPTGEPEETWPVITGQYFNRRAFGLHGDTLLNPDVVNPADPLNEWRLGLVRVSPQGVILDTLRIPDLGRRAHRFVARRGGNAAEMDLPFAATEHWAWHPAGFIVSGAGDAYSLTFLRPEGPLRVERVVEPVSVSRPEREQEEERVLNAMRWLDPSWRWDGPGIPRTKPFFSGIMVGAAGRVWVLRPGHGYEVDDPDFDPDDPYDTEIRWKEDRTFDVFQRDGTFLGSVRLPRDLDLTVPPVLRADTMWAVAEDDLGVQRIRRYELWSDATGESDPRPG